MSIKKVLELFYFVNMIFIITWKILKHSMYYSIIYLMGCRILIFDFGQQVRSSKSKEWSTRIFPKRQFREQNISFTIDMFCTNYIVSTVPHMTSD